MKCLRSVGVALEAFCERLDGDQFPMLASLVQPLLMLAGYQRYCYDAGFVSTEQRRLFADLFESRSLRNPMMATVDNIVRVVKGLKASRPAQPVQPPLTTQPSQRQSFANFSRPPRSGTPRSRCPICHNGFHWREQCPIAQRQQLQQQQQHSAAQQFPFFPLPVANSAPPSSHFPPPPPPAQQ